MNIILVSALILGFTSNLHCLGMCGPIALALPIKRTSIYAVIFGVLQYNLGRILTYSVLGLVIGSIGITVKTIGLMQGLSIFAGIILLGYAWRKKLQFSFLQPLSLGFGKVNARLMRKVITSQSPFKVLMLGAVNGLLPCGMIYIALLNAALAPNPQLSMFAMTFFGIGTLPIMLFVGFLAQKITQNMRQKANRFVPYLLTIVSVLMIVRGLGLGIPFLSPSVKIVQSIDKESVKSNSVELSCCHSNKKCE